MAFLMKQNDLRPYLPFQFFQPDGITPLDLTSATTIAFVCRVKGAPQTAPPKFKKPVVILDVLAGEGEYRWSGNDTDTVGNFSYEFEVIWSTGEPQTFPSDTYFDLVIADDLG